MHEQEVLALLRAGDERGAEALLRHYAPLMRYIIAPIVPDAQDREECLSDAALRVWEKFGTYDPARGSWTAWLTALTRNTALNRARKKSGGSEELSGDLPSAEPTPEERLLQQERRQALERADRAAAAGPAALLPQVLLPPVHRADRRGAGNDGARCGGAALPHQKGIAQDAGR